MAAAFWAEILAVRSAELTLIIERVRSVTEISLGEDGDNDASSWRQGGIGS
jgi:hypothetical protein